MELLILLLIAAVAGGTALAVFLRTDRSGTEEGNGHRAAQAHRPGLLAGAADIVDSSIGMYMLRRALGRPTSSRAERRAERARITLAQAEEGRRHSAGAGPAVVAPTRLVVAGTAASHSPRDLPDRQAHPVGAYPVVPAPTRRLPVSREGAVAAMGLVAVLSAAFALWPRDEGGVLSVTGTPPPSPTSDVSSPIATPSDSPTPTAAPTVAASVTQSPTTAATPTPTATPTATPILTPRPTARPTFTPRPTARPTATLTPTPTPTPGHTPTPKPTSIPTPTPTPTPVSTPTSAPTVPPTEAPTTPPTLPPSSPP